MLYTLYQIVHKDHLCSFMCERNGEYVNVSKTEKTSLPKDYKPLIFLTAESALSWINSHLDDNYFVQEFSGNEEIKEMAI